MKDDDLKKERLYENVSRAIYKVAHANDIPPGVLIRSCTDEILAILQSEKLALLGKLETLLIRNSCGINKYTYLSASYHMICLKGELAELKNEITSGEEQTKGETNE